MGGLVHIFAVDEGILALSDFRTPDVFHAFFGPLHWHVWVNDIYVQSKKAAGILVESALNQDGSFQYAVVGIGVNLFPPEAGFPENISKTATALFDTAQDDTLRKQFLKKLLLRFKKLGSSILNDAKQKASGKR